MTRPLVALTMGDPAGIGPETIVGAWTNPALHAAAACVAVGHPEVYLRAAKLLGDRVRVVVVDDPAFAEPSIGTLPVLRAGDDDARLVPPAKVDPRGGKAAYDSLRAAVSLAQLNRIDALTTAPLNKAALAAAGVPYPGHTEILAVECGLAPDAVAMMLYLPPGTKVKGAAGLGVAHVTLHMALADVFPRLTLDAIVATGKLADSVSRKFLPDGKRVPRVGVAALNPHAGEEGLFGREEIDVIAPAVERLRREGVSADGPIPADTLMVRAAAGEFDGVVAMYHDQGHIALKLLGMHEAVNITLGLPIVRTSVAHGTAFDKAWQGRAETGGLIAAVATAAKLARRKH